MGLNREVVMGLNVNVVMMGYIVVNVVVVMRLMWQ